MKAERKINILYILFKKKKPTFELYSVFTTADYKSHSVQHHNTLGSVLRLLFSKPYWEKGVT